MHTLTAEDLLHGAFYAAEQGGLLLRDAIHMWWQGRYSTAVALAVFAREEIGRHRILLEQRDKTKDAGPHLTAKDVCELCRDHREKIGRAITGVFYEYDPHNDPELKGQPEEKVDAIISARMAKKAEDLPGDTHKARFAALYVDVNKNGTWNRPCHLDAKASAERLYETLNDYVRVLDCIRCPQQSGRCMELAKALAAWPGRPSLPPVDDLVGFSEKKAPAA